MFNWCLFINSYWAQIKFPIQKLAIFLKIKPPAHRAYAPEGKSRNYAEAYKGYAAQGIPQIDPREIGSARLNIKCRFNWAGISQGKRRDCGLRLVEPTAWREKGYFWMETNYFKSVSPNFSSVMTAPRNENMEKINIRHKRFAVTAPTEIPLLKTSIADTAV